MCDWVGGMVEEVDKGNRGSCCCKETEWLWGGGTVLHGVPRIGCFLGKANLFV